MTDKCRLELREKLKDFYSPKQLEIKSAEFELEIDSAIKDAQELGVDPVQFLEERVNSNIKEIQMDARKRVLQIESHKTAVKQVEQFSNGQEGVDSLLHAQPGKRYQAHSGNVESKTAAERRVRAAMILNGLSELEGGMERALTGEFDSHVMRLIKGEVSEAEMGTIPREAHIIFQAVKKHNEYDYKRKIQVGANVGYKKHRMFKQRHNGRNMELLGKDKWIEKSSRDFDIVNDMEIIRSKADGDQAKLDKINDNPQAARLKYLSDFYDKIQKSRGKQGDEIDDDFQKVLFTGQASSLEKSASIKFKDAEAQLRYNQEVNGKSIMSMVLEDIRDNSGYIGSAEVLGPNPTATLNKLMGEVEGINTAKTKGKFKLASGRRAGVATSWQAKSADKIRKIADITKLGTAIFSTLPDFSLGAFVISGTTGQNYFSTLGKLFSDTIKAVPEANRREVQRRLAVYTDDLLYGNMNTRIGEGSGLTTNTFDEFSLAESKAAVADLDYKKMAQQGGNLIDAGHQKFMKYTGLPIQSEIIRTALAKNMAEYMSDVSSKSYGDLYKGTKGLMERFNIGEKEWDILRKLPSDLEDGTRLIDTESIHSVDGALTGKATEAEAEQYLNRLAADYSSMLTFVAEHGSPTPGVKTKAWVDSVDPNTTAGIMMKFFGQYKSFSIAVMDTLKEGMGPEFDKTRIGNFGYTAMVGMGLAYMGDSAKRMVQGKETRDIFTDDGKPDYGLAKDMLLRAGTGGLWADFLATDYNSSWRSLGADIAGPGIGVIESGLKAGHGLGQLISADNEKESRAAKKKILRQMELNTPSLLFTKSLINKNFYDMLHRASNTGAKR